MTATILHLSDFRIPRPRVSPCVGGTVCLTVGTGEHEREEHFELRAARLLLGELEEAISAAEHIERCGLEART